MGEYQYTSYFENEVLRKRPYLKKEWRIFVIENSIRVEVQSDDRVRFGDEWRNLVTACYGSGRWLTD